MPTITPPTTEGIEPAQESAGNNQGSANKIALPEKPKDITPENVKEEDNLDAESIVRLADELKEKATQEAKKLASDAASLLKGKDESITVLKLYAT